MYAFNTIVLAIAALAASVAAVPQRHGHGHGHGPDNSLTVNQAVDQCSGNNNGQAQVSCCNEETKDGLLSLLDNLSILGGACQPIIIPVNVLGGGGGHAPITEYCNNRVACCAGDSTASPCTLIG